MNSPKQKLGPALDAFLSHIKVNRKPMSLARLQWWLVIILTRIFGQKVEIEGAGGRALLKLFPVIWGRKLYLLGSEHEILQIDYTSPYTLRLTHAPAVVVGPGAPVREREMASKIPPVHVVLSHLPALKTDLILDYLHQLEDDCELLLAYGGTRENFETVRFPKKIFISDQKLRGLSHRQSYFGLMTDVHAYLKEKAIETEWILISDYDLVPLKKDYLQGLIDIMKKHEAGFGGKLIRDISLSNSTFLANAVREGVVERLPALNRPERKPIYYCLGPFLLFHRSCFDAILELKDSLNDMFFELAVPTAANLQGFRVISFDEFSPCLKHVRYRPAYSCAEAVELEAQGVEVIHPVKEIVEFIATRSGRTGA